ncbi:hypothetical protein HMPREF9098_0449 [Kingella denitrificans ATCC 33394]|uniref:Uncharacterized protein n=1 Tax=Kingella denitrificans ATCC 33394 TaxID=888741 RepID=F0EX70_9NEIS|nr:hypothetical protein HMPREF9098_0449 [Kingella denitrificans ATCC 33394]
MFWGKSVSNQWVQAAFHDDGVTLRTFRPAAKAACTLGFQVQAALEGGFGKQPA